MLLSPHTHHTHLPSPHTHTHTLSHTTHHYAINMLLVSSHRTPPSHTPPLTPHTSPHTTHTHTSPHTTHLPSHTTHHTHTQGTKAIMKDIAKFLPGIGWTFMFMEYPFLKRDWNKDEKRLAQSCKNLSDYPVNMLVSVCGVWVVCVWVWWPMYEGESESVLLFYSHVFLSKASVMKAPRVLMPR